MASNGRNVLAAAYTTSGGSARGARGKIAAWRWAGTLIAARLNQLARERWHRMDELLAVEPGRSIRAALEEEGQNLARIVVHADYRGSTERAGE